MLHTYGYRGLGKSLNEIDRPKSNPNPEIRYFFGFDFDPPMGLPCRITYRMYDVYHVMFEGLPFGEFGNVGIILKH